MLTSRLHRLPRGLCQLWQDVNRRHPRREGVGFHLLITGILAADPDMFYSLSPNRCSQSTGCLGFGSREIAVSYIVEPQKKRRKNQQSRVERPITDWFVSWSCLGSTKDFISEAEGIGNSLGVLWLQEQVLRKQMGRLRSSRGQCHGISSGLGSIRPPTTTITHISAQQVSVYSQDGHEAEFATRPAKRSYLP